MNTHSFSTGSSLFTGFTRLCRGLSVVLLGGYILLQIFPGVAPYVVLIPARTIPFAWNLVTAGYVETSFWRVIVSVVGLLLMGKLLEPLWGSKEFLKFIFIVNLFTCVCVFITALSLYYITRKEYYLYNPVSGFHGVLLGFLVGIKQILPDQELPVFSLLKIKAKWIPSLVVLASLVICFIGGEFSSNVPTIMAGTYFGWIYLRYLQRRPEINGRGDPSDDFSFSSFFPEFLRPVIVPIASLFDRMLGGNSKISQEGEGGFIRASPLPGSDPIEASRRRERGARALEERLAVEKYSGGPTSKNEADKDASDSV